jgi:hypothetical protein
VISQLPNSSAEGLRAAGTNYPDPVRERYLTLPGNGLDRTRELARDITEDMTNPYDAVLALNDYLNNGYPYDLSIPPQRENMDAVEYFLFEEQRGYCEQFSSSLAVTWLTLWASRRAWRRATSPASTTRLRGCTRSRRRTPTRGSRCTSPATAGPPSTRPGFDSTP